MKLKLDENIGKSGEGLLQSTGHDVATVRGEGLGGSGDEEIFGVCKTEGRVLITLDHDFGNVLRFPPEELPGTVVIELPPRPTRGALLRQLEDFLRMLSTRPLEGELWIVEPGRVRIHEKRDQGP